MRSDSVNSKSLDSFDLDERLAALEISAGRPDIVGQPERKQVNMHIHSFYSFNSHGYSPAHVAVEARSSGLYAAALCDFDVLDGLEEFMTAGKALSMRVAVHIETRAFLREYAHMDINSPGEPGVAYIMGAGFGCLPDQRSPAMASLNAFRQQANLRNRALVERINARLGSIALDYDSDVLPLSPGGCPTERHIVKAYRLKAEKVFPSGPGLSAFWSGLLKKSPEEVRDMFADIPLLEEKIRSLLAKSGGIGYVCPDDKTFPPVDDFIAWVLACNAIPMMTWLDGTSKGENDITVMLECMQAKGAAALNIIPDRNHRIRNAEERRVKMIKLQEAVCAARKLEFPVNIGTEMNKSGQPFFDDVDCEALAAYRPDFLRGANIMIGQTILSRFARFSYCSEAALGEYGRDTGAKNTFFASVGRLPPLNRHAADRLGEMGHENAFRHIRDSSAHGKWKL